MSGEAFTVRIATAIETIGRDAWDACANPLADRAEADRAPPCAEEEPDVDGQLYHPFISYDFLHALEKSASVGRRTGWTPLHIVVSSADGAVAAVMPAYGKSHSQGEYVFDWGWADAFERAGGRYYPKLQVSIPFTPVTGRRFLVRPGIAPAATRGALLAGARAALEAIKGSSIHMTFLSRSDAEHLGKDGFLRRTDQQFHWINEGYADFDAFLAALSSRKRKAIRRERRDALASGITIETLTGPAITPEAWDAFFSFYTDTGSRKWGRPYLTRAFFDEVARTMTARVLLVMARRGGRYIAGAINFIGSDTLYGRHWGAVEEHPFLHFEVCYYQAIEYAIRHKLARVEAGAQGEHKLARGYRPVTTHSAHFIADPGFRSAVEHYLARERVEVAALHDALEEAAPFRKG